MISIQKIQAAPVKSRLLNTNKILFLYGVQGTGHEKAAHAVMAALQKLDKKIPTEALPLVQKSFPTLGKMVNKTYLATLQYLPNVWGSIYDSKKFETFSKPGQRLLSKLSSVKTRSFIKKINPAVVVCTQALALNAIVHEKKAGRFHGAIIAIPTDFYVHRYWIHKEVDHYFVAHQKLKNALHKKGIPPYKMTVTGIPVHPRFEKKENQKWAKKKFNLDPSRKMALVMGGHYGLGAIKKSVAALKAHKNKYQTVVVCGRNQNLKKSLLNKADVVFGITNQIPTLMSAADVVVTKPGGMTCAEAIAKKRPLKLTAPLPGPEQKNALFFKKTNSKTLLKPDSAHKAAQIIISYL